MDPQVRNEAAGRLQDLFRGLGEQRQSGGSADLGDLGGIIGQFEELMTMPVDLAMLFLQMSVELAELVIQTLEEAGFILVKGVTPL